MKDDEIFFQGTELADLPMDILSEPEKLYSKTMKMMWSMVQYKELQISAVFIYPHNGVAACQIADVDFTCKEPPETDKTFAPCIKKCFAHEKAHS